MRLAACLILSLAGCAHPAIRDGDASVVYRRLVLEKPPDLIATFGGAKEERAAVAEALRPYEPVLAELARASRLPRCEWRYDAPASHFTAFPHEGNPIQAAKLLGARALLRFGEGRHSEGVEDLLAALKVAVDHLHDRGTLSRLSGAVAVVIVQDALRIEWARRPPGLPEVRRIEEAVTAMLPHFPSYRRFLENEKALLEASAADLLSRGAQEFRAAVTRRKGSEESGGKWALLMDLLLRSDPPVPEEALVRRWAEDWRPMLEDAGELPFGRPPRFDREAFARTLPLEESPLELIRTATPEKRAAVAADLIFLMVAPSLDKVKRVHAESRVLLENLRDACRVESHRLRHGSYPETLDRAPDPFDGRPLRYRRFASAGWEGALLHSGDCSVDWERLKPRPENAGDGFAWWLWRKR